MAHRSSSGLRTSVQTRPWLRPSNVTVPIITATNATVPVTTSRRGSPPSSGRMPATRSRVSKAEIRASSEK